MDAVNPAVQGHVLAAKPSVLQDRALRHIDDLLDDIEFNQRVTVKGNDGLDLMYRAAIDAVAQARRG